MAGRASSRSCVPASRPGLLVSSPSVVCRPCQCTRGRGGRLSSVPLSQGPRAPGKPSCAACSWGHARSGSGAAAPCGREQVTWDCLAPPRASGQRRPAERRPRGAGSASAAASPGLGGQEAEWAPRGQPQSLADTAALAGPTSRPLGSGGSSGSVRREAETFRRSVSPTYPRPLHLFPPGD